MKLWHLASAFALLAEPFVLADLAYCATDNTGSGYDAGRRYEVKRRNRALY
jgi:hypothetical protein